MEDIVNVPHSFARIVSYRLQRLTTPFVSDSGSRLGLARRAVLRKTKKPETVAARFVGPLSGTDRHTVQSDKLHV